MVVTRIADPIRPTCPEVASWYGPRVFAISSSNAAVLGLSLVAGLSLAAGCSNPQGWSDQTQVIPGEDFVSPLLVGGPNGTALAIWQEPNPDRSVEEQFRLGIAARWYTSGRWREVTILDNYAGANSFASAAAIDGEGNAFAVWIEEEPRGFREDRRGRVLAKRHTERDGWGNPNQIGETTNTRAGPRVTASPTGRAYVVYPVLDSTVGFAQLAVAEYDPSDGWDDSALYTTDIELGTVELLDVGVSDTDELIVVWYTSGTPPSTRVSRYSADSGWSAPSIFDNDQLGASPQVAIGSDGTAWAYWPASDDALLCPSVTRNTGSGWEAVVELDPDCERGAGGTFAIDDAGGAIAIWTLGFFDDAEARFSQYVEGSGWSQWERMPLNDGFGAPFIGVAALPTQRAAAIWYRLPDAESTLQAHVWAGSFDPATGWEEPIQFSANGPVLSVNARYGPPQLVRYPSGEALGIFRQSADAGDAETPSLSTLLWSSRFR